MMFLISLIGYTIGSGAFTLMVMSIAQGRWWYTFGFSTIFFFWVVTLYFAITNAEDGE